MNAEKINILIKETAAEWKVPVSMLVGKAPETPEQQKASAEWLEFHDKQRNEYRKALVLDLTAHLQAAAVKCDTYHVFADYAPHVDTLSVVVRSKTTNYQAPFAEWPTVLLSEYVRLSDEEAAERLVAIIERLWEMGVVV